MPNHVIQAIEEVIRHGSDSCYQRSLETLDDYKLLDEVLKLHTSLDDSNIIIIHVHHPSLDESREVRSIPGRKAISKAKAVLESLDDMPPPTTDQAITFHRIFLEVYFSLVGRTDSFSESVLRMWKSEKPFPNPSPLVTLALNKDKDQYEKDGTKECMAIHRGKCHELIGGGDDIVGGTDQPLVKDFYRHIWETYIADLPAQPPSDLLQEKMLRDLRQKLDSGGFFEEREAYIGCVAAKLASRGQEQFAFLTNRLYGGVQGKHFNSVENLSRVNRVAYLSKAEQCLGTVQASMLFQPISSDAFSIVGVKQGNFWSGVTFGREMWDFTSHCWLDADAKKVYEAAGKILTILLSVLEGGQENEATSSEFLLTNELNWTLRDGQIQEDVVKETEGKIETFGHDKKISRGVQYLWYLTHRLRGRRHETSPISIRMVLGYDDELREYFLPVRYLQGKLDAVMAGRSAQGQERPATMAALWRAPLHLGPVKEHVKARTLNAVELILSAILGNCAFLEHSHLYLCFAIVRRKEGSENSKEGSDNSQHDEIKGRYIGRLNVRTERRRSLGPSGELLSELESVEGLSRCMPNVVLSITTIQADAFIATGGVVIKHFAKHDLFWRDRPHQEWLALAFERETGLGASQTATDPLERWSLIAESLAISDYDIGLRDRYAETIETIFRVISRLSETDGFGGILVLDTQPSLDEEGGPATDQRFDVERASVAMSGDLDRTDGSDSSFGISLLNIARQDGATIIKLANGEAKVQGRRRITDAAKPLEPGKDPVWYEPFNPWEWKPPTAENPEELYLANLWDFQPVKQEEKNPYQWKKWASWLQWGTRHTSAAAVAYQGQGRYKVFCVSSDGPVHYFNGYTIYELGPERGS